MSDVRGVGRPMSAVLYDPLQVTWDDTVVADAAPRSLDELTAVNGKLNAAEFQYLLDRLGIERLDLVAWLGVSRRYTYKLGSGDSEVPAALGKLLILMARLGLTIEQV